MKRLKFEPALVQLILDGKKTATWRLFDDKDLQVGDQLELVEFGTNRVFARTEIVGITEKPLGEVTEEDFAGHEKFPSRDVMLATYRGYYGDRVNWDTIVKMINFKHV